MCFGCFFERRPPLLARAVPAPPRVPHVPTTPTHHPYTNCTTAHPTRGMYLGFEGEWDGLRVFRFYSFRAYS